MGQDQRGHLSPQQYKVLKLRVEGKSQEETAEILGTTRQNISLIERRAHKNIEKAEETITAYKELMKATSIIIKSDTHLIDVPRLVVDAADEAGVRLRADFTRIYNEFKFIVPNNVDRTKVVEPIKVLILKDGDIVVTPV
ncbi:MAG: Tfx family DNA-binding protein [Candidatus Bathyarchaeota archaeon]|nr:Tfx family DNA-binding protein [Candidatus Bathyarchaeota archaeon]